MCVCLRSSRSSRFGAKTSTKRLAGDRASVRHRFYIHNESGAPSCYCVLFVWQTALRLICCADARKCCSPSPTRQRTVADANSIRINSVASLHEKKQCLCVLKENATVLSKQRGKLVQWRTFKPSERLQAEYCLQTALLIAKCVGYKG